MIIAGVLAALLTVCLLSVTMWVGFVLLKRRLMRSLRKFLEQPTPDKPSQLAVMVDQASYILATRIVGQFKASFMQMSSVDVRNDRKAATAEMLASNPVLATVLSAIPGARRLLKNPELLSLIGGAFEKMKSGGNGNKLGATELPNIQGIFPL